VDAQGLPEQGGAADREVVFPDEVETEDGCHHQQQQAENDHEYS
jgi:hypothetical protein